MGRSSTAGGQSQLVAKAQGFGPNADAAKQQLLDDHAPLIARIARSLGLRRGDQDYEDAMQAGRVGFLRAIHRFDSTRGATIGAFAQNYVRGEIVSDLFDRRGSAERPAVELLEPDELVGVTDSTEHAEHLLDLPERIDVRRFLLTLSERERRLAFAVHWTDKSQSAAGGGLGMNRMTALRTMRRIYDKGSIYFAEDFANAA